MRQAFETGSDKCGGSLPMLRRSHSRLLACVTAVAVGLPIAAAGFHGLNSEVVLAETRPSPRSWNSLTRVNWEVEERANSTFGEVPISREPVSREPALRQRRAEVDESIRATIRTVPRRISQLTNDALHLAVKGATYSANAKLLKVLELIADQLDTEQRTTRHSMALAAGLTALRESEDFTRTSSMSMTMTSRAVGHATPVFGDGDSEEVTRLEALERYYSYASRQLGEAVQGMPEGSAGLCHLGRLQPYLTDGDERSTTLVAARMVALQTAALIADPLNYRAANELGVVLARHGQLNAAREKLLYSAEISKRPETVRNLGIVLHKLGDESGSRLMISLADQKSRKPQPGRDSETVSLVNWVDHEQFSARAAAEEISQPAAPSTANPSGSKAANASDKPAGKPVSGSPWRWKNGAFRRDAQVSQAAGESSSQNDSSPMNNGRSAKPKSGGRANIQTVAHNEGNPGLTYTDVMDTPPIGIGHSGDSLRQFSSGFDDGYLSQGEYIGPPRLAHTPEYFLRVDDSLSFVFRLNGKPSLEPYRLNLGDVIKISSLTTETLLVETMVQPDGTIVLPQIGSVAAAGKTIDALRRELDRRYSEYLRVPSITVSPININRTVEELRSSIINRTGAATGAMNAQIFNSFGQLFNSKVTPNGVIQLPAIGSVPAQGLTLDELRREVEARYAEIAGGIEVTPVLSQRAPHYVYVLGEVAKPGRFDLVAPTSVIQSISLAGGWNKGGNLNEVIIIRRDDSWHLMATRVKVRPTLYNYPELASEDIWLRDSDIVIVPKLTVQVCDDWIELIFTKGIYGVIPFGGVSFAFFKDVTSLGLLK